MVDNFKIRFQLIDIDEEKVYDWFDMDIPNRVSGCAFNYSESPFLVSQALFDKMRKRLKR